MTSATYRTIDAARILGVSAPTLRYWESEIPQLSPQRTQGGRRTYSQKDIELCKLIKTLAYEKGLSLKAVREKIDEYTKSGSLPAEDVRPFACDSTGDALRLLSELKIKCEADPYAVARIEAVEVWMKAETPAKKHKNIRGKEYYAKATKENKADSGE